jgi:hypothetical protein
VNAAPEPEMMRADPRWRLLVLISFPVVLLLALWGSYWLKSELAAAQDLAEQSLPDGAERLIAVSMNAFGVIAAILTLVAVYLGFFAVRVLRHHQYPPPGAKVSRDTPILRGAAARRQGLLLLGIALIVPATMFFMMRQAEQKLRDRLDSALQAPRVKTVFPADELQ